MIKIKNNKTFMDSVHGYINVPNCFVKNLIDTEYFQRLRNIDQTGVRIVYPCVKHDRFSHSIGVFHLGQKAVESLINSIIANNYCDKQKDYTIIELERNRILFLIACLLHDIGHTPFSHSLENQVLKNTNKLLGHSIAEELAEKIKEYETEYLNFCNNNNNVENISANVIEKKVAAHEQMGANLIFSDFFREKIKNIFIDLNNDSNDIKFDLTDDKKINDDLCFIVRMIMGIKYEDYSEDRQLRNCFIELLNGDNFDVDKMDYIIRDTKMTGISNVEVDVERLLSSICINKSTKYYNKYINTRSIESEVTILNLKNIKKNDNIQINGEIKGIVSLKKGTKVTLMKDSYFTYLKGKIALKEGTLGKFDKETIVKFDGYKADFDTVANSIVVRGCDHPPYPIYLIENAKLLERFVFTAEEDGVELCFHKSSNVIIDGAFESKGTISIYRASNVAGSFSEIEILGNAFDMEFTKNKQNKADAYNSYYIGFKKQAMNVIANVLKARNFLYLWIYAHHKVVYYANFLVPIITHELFKKYNKIKKFAKWNLSYHNIQYLDDSYIWTLIRYIKYSNVVINPQLNELIDEVLQRKYRNSLYKSLVEYDLFFDSFSENDKKLLISKIPNLIDKEKPNIIKKVDKKKICDIGYFNTQEITEINDQLKAINEKYKKIEENSLIKIEELIYVAAQYKMKKLQTSKIYIDMGNENYMTISRMPLLEVDSIKDSNNLGKSYFYLYYKSNKEKPSMEELTLLKKAIKKYFKKKITTKGL